MTDRPATYFETAADLRAWFAANADHAAECWIGLVKSGAGAARLTRKKAIDEALAVGWIDGHVQGVDAQRYRVRFTPRKPQSIWSQVNIKRFAELKAEGRIEPRGQRAYDACSHLTKRYSFENEEQSLSADQLAQFRAQPAAWAWFEQQPPSYRKTTIWLVVSAKRPETQQRRLQTLIDASLAQQRLR